jgi:hypothetical protein
MFIKCDRCKHIFECIGEGKDEYRPFCYFCETPKERELKHKQYVKLAK